MKAHEGASAQKAKVFAALPNSASIWSLGPNALSQPTVCRVQSAM